MTRLVSRCVLGEALEGAVLGGVVDGAVVPAVPGDVEPGSGEHRGRVGPVVASGAGSRVRPRSSEVCSVGVGDGVAELSVAGPAEADAPISSSSEATDPRMVH